MRNQFIITWIILLTAGACACSAHGGHFKYSHTIFIYQWEALTPESITVHDCD